VQCCLGLVLFAPRDEANAAASNLRTYWRELGFQVMPDQYFALPLFLHCLPFGADRAAIPHLMRYRTLAASHATALLPVFGDWKGTGEPVLNLVGRNGQLMDVNLFDSLTNCNAVVAASSGSGKSFLANEIIATNLSVGGRCWVIDVGRSYQNLCEAFDGQYGRYFHGRNSIAFDKDLVVLELEELKGRKHRRLGIRVQQIKQRGGVQYHHQ
jgi:conjugal transfer ATP-binding protein TraC